MTCFALVRGYMMRVTRLDACGAKVLGPSSTVVSEGFISVAYTANTEEGESISIPNASGKICILDEPAPTFTGYDVEVTFCGVDPELYSLMTGQPVVYNDAVTPVPVGFQVNSDVDLAGQGFAIELWSRVPAAACEGGNAAYGYLLNPFLQGGIIGDFTVENAAVNFTLSGAKTKDGNSWGVGPYDVIREAVSGDPSPLLEALPVKNHLHMQLTTLAPPVDACGAQPLGVEATGATAGIPATLTPANSYAPLDLADAIAGPFVASPTTAWTTGQYVLTRSGQHIKWNGTAWVAA